jgi:hypothetical protein
VQGEVPNPLNPPTGCAFHPRCPQALPVPNTLGARRDHDLANPTRVRIAHHRLERLVVLPHVHERGVGHVSPGKQLYAFKEETITDRERVLVTIERNDHPERRIFTRSDGSVSVEG